MPIFSHFFIILFKMESQKIWKRYSPCDNVEEWNLFPKESRKIAFPRGYLNTSVQYLPKRINFQTAGILHNIDVQRRRPRLRTTALYPTGSPETCASFRVIKEHVVYYVVVLPPFDSFFSYLLFFVSGIQQSNMKTQGLETVNFRSVW